MVRGRWLAVDLLGAGLWAVGLVVALTALGDMLAATTALGQPRGAVAGAIGAAPDRRGGHSHEAGAGPADRCRAESVTTA